MIVPTVPASVTWALIKVSANRKTDCACNVDSSANDGSNLPYSVAGNPNPVGEKEL